ncbi:MAG TPA: hypothetical protein VN783_16220, partial [Thermoanaerobaculia bacterium]|nr:hypothetical protein [Thermoanaerobaculia bacterium]
MPRRPLSAPVLSILPLLALTALLGAAPLSAGICFMDDVPAATLLLPYFEVDLDNPSGITTVMSINNATSAAVLAHVVFWTDLSVPTLDFDVYLTGYDVQAINLRDVFNGALPSTASAGQDPSDVISPKGAFSQDVNFASCAGQLPPPPLPAVLRTHIQAAHTGLFSVILNGCAGLEYGDHVARGYVTVDMVKNCTLRLPGDPGYFGPNGTGDASNVNALWGDYFYVDSVGNVAEGDTLVHIEASFKNPETSGSGQYTFYGRYVNWTGIDNREPLSSHFASRYVNGGAFSGGTDFIVWRDSKVNQSAFKCGTLPGWYPLLQEQIVTFDEQEHPTVFQALPGAPQPFPAEAQRTHVDGPALPVPFDFGWAFLDLNANVPAAGANPPEDPAAGQAWVSTVMTGTGRFGIGFDAI